jgi:hypothetical protein
MSVPEPKHQGYTIEDWKAWDGRWELINGVAFDMTPASSFEHQRTSMALSISTGNALSESKQKHGGGLRSRSGSHRSLSAR